ncbi:AlbA family DNA-binding domain-containing protein [Streptomyces sp. BA2]|uniref:AlbA family DNA-binding domain-containing protein n=1 Tax=Streptomyces sp. BA2 TaxID=436595 RepID=UPI001320C5E0|nr:ATP-binding protein [Streptomyces sp. BA2]MWA14595.1 ATP-binding protein [Streptomyces sp. BA2]
MVTAAVADRLDEKDDLDWKEKLPSFAPKPGIWNEFAKDVAAMANTRGGLLVYGVSDQIELVGVDLAMVDKKQMLSAVRNGIQPYISGVDFIELPAPGGGGPDFLVVDIPPSEMAPHFQYGWEQKDKDRVTFNAPYRINDDTFYMTEHQVARAYQDRFTRRVTADALLKERLVQATEIVLSESPEAHAWLVIVTQLTRPVPHLVPRPLQAEAREVLQLAIRKAVRVGGATGRPTVLSGRLADDLRVGLRRWTGSNFLTSDYRSLSSGKRGVLVELHHDGAVVVGVDLSTRLAAGDDIAVDTGELGAVAQEAVTLADTHRLHRAPDTAVEITAAVPTAHTNRRIVPFEREFGMSAPAEGARHPRHLLPSSTELAPNADDETLRSCAHELADGLLHQFGIDFQR